MHVVYEECVKDAKVCKSLICDVMLPYTEETYGKIAQFKFLFINIFLVVSDW